MSQDSHPKHLADALDSLPVTIHWETRALNVVCDEEGTTGARDERTAEWTALWFRRRAGGPLRPRGRGANESDEQALRKCVEALGPAEWDRLEKRSRESVSAMVRATFSDFLWGTRSFRERVSAYPFAKQAIASLISVGRQLLGSLEDSILALGMCELASRVALEINDRQSVAEVVALTGELVDSFRGRGRVPLGILLMGSRVAREACVSLMSTELRNEAIGALEGMLARLVDFMPDDSSYEASPEGREVLEERIKIEAQLGGRPISVSRVRIGESFATQARERAAAGDYLLASSFAGSAMRVFANEGEKQRAEEMKRRVREWNQLSLPQMGVYSVVISTPVEQVEAWIADVRTRSDAGTRIRHAFATGPLIPDWQTVERDARARAEESPLLALLPVVSTVDGRPVDRQADGRLDILRREWLMAIFTGVDRWWVRLRELLFKTEGFTDFLVKELVSAGVLPADRVRLARRAVDSSIAGDVSVACYLLPPLLEACLRSFFVRRGIDMNAYRPVRGGVVNERLLSEPFSNDPQSEIANQTRAVLGPNLWNWYRVVLVDEPAGMNLRNRVAHGLLTDDECSPLNASLLTLGVVALLTLSADGEQSSVAGD